LAASAACRRLISADFSYQITDKKEAAYRRERKRAPASVPHGARALCDGVSQRISSRLAVLNAGGTPAPPRKE